MKSQAGLDHLDQETKQNIARALWLPELKASELPEDLLTHLSSEKNSSKAFGQRMQVRLKELLSHRDSFTPSYRKRYEAFLEHVSSLTPHQAYVMANLLGPESCRGYEEIPARKDFQFPRDDAPQLDYQLGWHFFVGSCGDSEGQEYGVEIMFWQYALLPPALARQQGLSDWENQVLELHLAVSVAGEKHYRARPVVVAGTTGLLDFTENPYNYTLGRNSIRSTGAGSLFPLRLRARGQDLGWDSSVEIDVDLTLDATKDYFLQGDAGVEPSVGGVGTLYYSVPNLRVGPSASWLALNGKKVALANGKFWYDHQWTNGLGPTGNPRLAVLRAASNLAEAGPGGWDWFMAQFDDDLEVTLAATHSIENRSFYEQTRPNPPGTMTAAAMGKFIDRDGSARDIHGELKVTEWIRSERSPDPDLYPVTNTWYPNHWQFEFGADVPEEVRSFHMVPIVATGQAGFFASGPQYSEGAVYLEDDQGRRIGRGFAESVSYADTRRNLLRLAGLPDTPEMLKLIERQAPSPFLKLRSLLYVAWPSHKAELKEQLESYNATMGS